MLVVPVGFGIIYSHVLRHKNGILKLHTKISQMFLLREVKNQNPNGFSHKRPKKPTNKTNKKNPQPQHETKQNKQTKNNTLKNLFPS